MHNRNFNVTLVNAVVNRRDNNVLRVHPILARKRQLARGGHNLRFRLTGAVRELLRCCAHNHLRQNKVCRILSIVVHPSQHRHGLVLKSPRQLHPLVPTRTLHSLIELSTRTVGEFALTEGTGVLTIT